MVGKNDKKKGLRNNPDFIALESDPADQPVDWREARLAVAIIVGAIAASFLGVPVFFAMLVAALVVVILGVITMEEAYRTVEWQGVFVIAGVYSGSIAMGKTGLAGLIC